MASPLADDSLDRVALFSLLPALRGRLPWARLGDWPTAVEPLGLGPDVLVKREDLSSPVYGGNKVRTLEAALGAACGAGARVIWATGAYGSNHAVATVLHARQVGLEAGIALFPQPPTRPAHDNLAAALSAAPHILRMHTVLELPAAMALLRARARWTGEPAAVMAPGAAIPAGAFGALSAALELAQQVASGACPAPARIVLAVGSTCTTAGLLAGLWLAREAGLAFARGLPLVHAVRVTPWPITSRSRIAHLALRTSEALAELAGRLPGRQPAFWDLYDLLRVDGRYLGAGYGRPTAAGLAAMTRFARAGGPPLDVVYSAKSGAALLDLIDARTPGPLLFWATKSSAPLPRPTAAQKARAPRALRRWLDRPLVESDR